jgi:hypothetical protein
MSGLSLPETYVGLTDVHEATLIEHAEQVQRNFETIAGDSVDGNTLVHTVGGVPKTMNDGVQAFNWPGGTATTTVTVTHGLGRVPTSIQVTAHSEGVSLGGFFGAVKNSVTSATTFTVKLLDPLGAPAAGADAFFWTVFG